jgi:hypothetical protein
MYTRT